MDGSGALDLLWSTEGQELLELLWRRGPVEAGAELPLAERLRARYPPELVRGALAQQELRERARAKFSRPDRMFFTREGLEQSSAELVARHRAARYRPFERVADLCTGIGGDLLALAAGRAALAVDLDPVQLRIALRNARALGAAEVAGACAEVRTLRLDALPPVFVDPARRAGGRRLPPGVSQPPLAWCLALADHVAEVGIKAAPAGADGYLTRKLQALVRLRDDHVAARPPPVTRSARCWTATSPPPSSCSFGLPPRRPGLPGRAPTPQAAAGLDQPQLAAFCRRHATAAAAAPLSCFSGSAQHPATVGWTPPFWPS
jgi:hypothetical protein